MIQRQRPLVSLYQYTTYLLSVLQKFDKLTEKVIRGVRCY